MRRGSILLILALSASVRPATAQTYVPAATTIKTEKGEFQVPGRAYLDGRDLEAQPPVTVMNIRVWQSPFRTHAICTAEHATQVDLLEVQRSAEEKRYYFRVRAPKCEGWVPETSLSTKKNAPIAPQR
jgi:hypothetical protein